MSDHELAGLAFESQADLGPYNTLQLPSRAAMMIRIRSVTDLHAVLDVPAAKLPGPVWVLGGGSNVVLSEVVERLVLKVELQGRACIAEDGEAWYVAAAGGENWHDFVQWTLQQGRPGLENLSLIPGTVGAAPVQNIGAYGVEMGSRVAEVEAVDLRTGELCRFAQHDCGFAYRDSVFKRAGQGRWLITRVVFRLPKQWRPMLEYPDVARQLGQFKVAPKPQQVAEAICTIRRSKLPDPQVIGNAGSFFKNPLVAEAQLSTLLQRHPDMPHYPQPHGQAKLAAGWLIERCGWKGRQLGPVGCYAKQALVLVNHGGATAADVQRTAAAIIADVQRTFGITLEAEPSFI